MKVVLSGSQSIILVSIPFHPIYNHLRKGKEEEEEEERRRRRRRKKKKKKKKEEEEEKLGSGLVSQHNKRRKKHLRAALSTIKHLLDAQVHRAQPDLQLDDGRVVVLSARDGAPVVRVQGTRD